MSREQIIADYADAASSALDEAAMRLSLLGAFCWLGGNKALDAAEHLDPSCERASDRTWTGGSSGPGGRSTPDCCAV